VAGAETAPALVGRLDALAADLRLELIELRRQEAVSGGEQPPLRERIAELVGERAGLLGESSRSELIDRIVRETIGLGPLEELLVDPEVEEVMVNGPDEVWVERRGRLQRVEAAFESEDQLRDVIERILGPLGRRVDELSPMADGRLADGSRVNVVIPPLAVDGPAVSIRRFGAERPDAEQLERSGCIPAELMGILREAVAGACSVLISGGTGSGKTTVLNALSAFIGPAERVITVEDAAELRLLRPHVVRLETRPASVEGEGGISIRDLVRNALRMRPDRLIIGEVRGAEAMDLLVALNTGHRGALSTVHANSPADALRRLEMLAMMAGLEIPYELVRRQLAGGLQLILHLERGNDGRRHAIGLAEVVEVAGSGPGTRELWAR
jgi:pilus assembly protein CpaF